MVVVKSYCDHGSAKIRVHFRMAAKVSPESVNGRNALAIVLRRLPIASEPIDGRHGCICNNLNNTRAVSADEAGFCPVISNPSFCT